MGVDSNSLGANSHSSQLAANFLHQTNHRTDYIVTWQQSVWQKYYYCDHTSHSRSKQPTLIFITGKWCWQYDGGI